MKVVTIVGARPQFVKAAPISRCLRRRHSEVLLHTGQHYDDEMSAAFFRELQIPEPDYNLGVGSGSHARQTGDMLIGVEEVLLKERPDWVLVFGDTNSTLAGALAATKIRIPCAHIEAGLRSANRSMPEELNRIAVDHLADLLFGPTMTAMRNLAAEGLAKRSVLTGDVMYDAMRMFSPAARQTGILDRLRVSENGYFVATIHRAGAVDNPTVLREVVSALELLADTTLPVILPLHPRTRNAMNHGAIQLSRIKVIDPLPYLEMLGLLLGCRAVLTDSGGLQKEAYLTGKICFTLREETEWVETVECGANILCGVKKEGIVERVGQLEALRRSARFGLEFYGSGDASERIIQAMETWTTGSCTKS
jgi:UDP-GlcNAc3NAcA epimerase